MSDFHIIRWGRILNPNVAISVISLWKEGSWQHYLVESVHFKFHKLPWKSGTQAINVVYFVLNLIIITVKTGAYCVISSPRLTYGSFTSALPYQHRLHYNITLYAGIISLGIPPAQLVTSIIDTSNLSSFTLE